MTFTFLLLVTRLGAAADGITTVRDAQGHVVYVNDSSSPTNTFTFEAFDMAGKPLTPDARNIAGTAR